VHISYRYHFCQTLLPKKPFELPSAHCNDNSKDYISLKSPGAYLSIDSTPYLASKLESTIKKDWSKQEEMFPLNKNGDLGKRSMELENENQQEVERADKDHDELESYEPKPIKKMKINDEDDAIDMVNPTEEMRISEDPFPMGEGHDNDYSIFEILELRIM